MARQASVLVGEPGISLADTDSYALDVLGDILNSFGGRLFDQIRSREVCLFEHPTTNTANVFVRFVFHAHCPNNE